MTILPPSPRRRLLRRGPISAAALVVLVAVTVAGCGGSQPRRPEATQTVTTTRTATQTTTSSASPSTTSTSTSQSTTTSASATPPPTVVNSNCKPPPQHPDPVLLVPGTYGATSTSWRLIAPKLAALGYCVYTFAYGNDETGPIATSAQQLATEVTRVLAQTGARRVSIVGHSQGGMMPRYYIKFLGGAAKVDKLVGLAPSNQGTLNPSGFGGALTGCVACLQQETGSAFLTKLNAGDQTPPPVDYTVIETVYDEVVIPYTSAFLAGPASRVTNVTLQQRCPDEIVGHIGIPLDPVALQWVENALSSNGPADPNFVPTC